MTRKELADASGVSDRTLYEYIKSNWQTLAALGCIKYKRLTPAAVKFICENYGIDL
ncbi:MAG: hypothetical protein ACI3Z8_04660 [Paludibacteraceae bacterium]